jgi:hypothetical protein
MGSVGDAGRTSQPTLVSVSGTVSAAGQAAVSLDLQALHGVAHAAVRAQRKEDGSWGDLFSTALVAATDSRHPPTQRGMAERAYDSVLGRMATELPRPTGDDAAAVALAARAALEIDGGSNALTEQASQLLRAACQDGQLMLAALHVALAVWALDPLVPNRTEPPWDDVRGSLERFSTTGLNRALVVFTRWISDQQVRSVPRDLAETSTLSRPEECVLLWLLTVAVDMAIARGADPATDEDLRTVVARRADIAENLAREVTAVHLEERHFDEFDPFADEDDESDSGADGLGLFEAIMLDFALSGPREAQVLITLDEAAKLAVRLRDRRFATYRRIALVATAVQLANTITICALADANTRISIGACLILLGSARIATLILLTLQQPPAEYVAAWIGVVLTGALLVVDGWRATPIVDDEIAAVIGIALVLIPAGATFLLGHWRGASHARSDRPGTKN